MMRAQYEGNDSMEITVTAPDRMNATFADAFNSRSIDGLLQLYEPDAALRTNGDDTNLVGLAAIRDALEQLLQVPGRMTSRNHFCIVQGNLALLRADWDLVSEEGSVLASGSSAEVVRRQADGRWLYVIDHAVGAGRPRMPVAGTARQRSA